MKYLMIVIPGASDLPTDELDGKTPIELAKIPNLHHFAKIGKVGQVKLTSDRHEPASDVTFLNLLGYDASKVYSGRGPLEAANLDLNLDENEVAFRMNFITEAEGVLADETGGGISSKEAKALINFLNKKVASDFVRFFSGSKYRHIAVIKDSHGSVALSAKTIAPETIIGDRLDAHFPKGPGEELLKKLMYDARLLLQNHEINQVRVDLKENPANMIWLWGQGQIPKLEKFREQYGVTGALLAEMEYAQGIARLADLTVVEIPETQENEDPDYERIAKLMMDAVQEKDFVCVHLNACDEASRKGDSKTKASALEGIDFFVLSKVRKLLESSGDVRVLVTTCHTASWKTQKHTKDLAPFVLAGKNVVPDDIENFTEAAAKVSDLKMSTGYDLMNLFFARS